MSTLAVTRSPYVLENGEGDGLLSDDELPSVKAIFHRRAGSPAAGIELLTLRTTWALENQISTYLELTASAYRTMPGRPPICVNYDAPGVFKNIFMGEERFGHGRP
jgi:hypothetical protein